MTSILKADTIQDTDGNNIINENSNTITIGASGDTVTIPSGATLDASNATLSGFATTNGITMADSWRITAAVTFSTQQTIDSNWERNDSSGTGTIGSAMTQSSGIFTFPSTGIYQVIANASFYRNGNDRYIEMHIQHSSNGGGSFNIMARNQGSINDQSANTFDNVTVIAHLDITNTSNDQVRFRIEAPADTVMNGSTSQNEGQSFTFVRLGDT
jgi:hypothetical protein